MSTLESKSFSSLSSTNVILDEYNEQSLDLTVNTVTNGLYIKPSEYVPGRTNVTGYILTAANNFGKVEWAPNEGGGSVVQGHGSIWFSTISGLPDGDMDNLYWDNNLKRMGIGNKTPEFELDVTGTIQAQNISLYDQSNTTRKIILDAPALPASYTFTLPQIPGTLGQILSTDGSGITSWVTPEPLQTVPGEGRLWFSDPTGLPQGSGDIVWDGTDFNLTGNFVINGTTFATIIQTNPTQTIDTTLTLPPDNGTVGYVLTTDGAGTLTWTAKGDGGPNVPGLGAIWFSDASGEPLGNNTQLSWDGTSIGITGSILLQNGSGNTMEIVQSNLQVGNLTLTLPINNGAVGYVLTTDGAGTLSWTANGGGGNVVPGLGLVWFSDAGGNPVGSSGNFVWNEVDKILTAGNTIKLNNSTFTHSITPGTLVGDISWILPPTNGTSGYVLTTDGAGVLSWTTNGSSVTVPGEGRLWFSDPTGEPQGSGDIIWDGTDLGIIGGIALTNAFLFKTTITASPLQSVDLLFTLPPDAGLITQVLSTDGAGVLSWITPEKQTVVGQNRVWYSNATGNPIGSANLQFNGTTLTVVGDTVTNDLSATTVTLRSGLFTTIIETGIQSGDLTLTLPVTAGTSGQFLTTDGAGVLSWATQASTVPGGNNGNVQFKNGSSFAGSDVFSFDGTVVTISDGLDTGKLSCDLLDVGSAAQFQVDAVGNVTATKFTATSDIRLKSNVVPIDGDYLENVNVYSYNLRDSEDISYGIIAQEIERMVGLRHIVHNNPDGYKSVDYIQLIPLLIKKVNELSREVKNLKQEWK